MSWHQRPRRFVLGPVLRDIVEVVTSLHHDRWIMYRGKPMHPAIVRNWSILQIENAARLGWLRVASPNPEHPANRPLAAVEEMEMPI